jgi:hypothetical protein|tara:strand:- start:1423 stop:1674 length:252 start_codon:yes stop_codon:yes gene_type:complete
MPLYTFKDKNKNIEYDKELSYEDLQEYIKQDHIEQVFKMNIFRYADGGGIKDQFTDWCKDSTVKGKGNFNPYGKATKDFEKKD